MQDRAIVIEQAAAALESGDATPSDGQDPQSMADMLRKASERGGLGAFAAYKAAQRILAVRQETPAQAARADRDYWVDRDYGGEPDDPSAHYYL